MARRLAFPPQRLFQVIWWKLKQVTLYQRTFGTFYKTHARYTKALTLCSLVEAVNFETDEALLTGESLPVRKEADTVFDEETGPGDRLNIAYSSSTVTKGRARGIVFATGMFTEIGTIATALRKKDSKVRPVKRKSGMFD